VAFGRLSERRGEAPKGERARSRCVARIGAACLWRASVPHPDPPCKRRTRSEGADMAGCAYRRFTSPHFAGDFFFVVVVSKARAHARRENDLPRRHCEERSDEAIQMRE
jgi:hypothetical protein